ncbi:hypothetical protein COLSTE_01284 [Collinsella stercoris DSM 13279]|uniref:Uncharacterized protein n=1 Tax=Collinsella stercoris DSM 13279 TaxID=445975 RepID=B6GB30_9ACTN|nr:hypothetical protein COLSTE_01284 [Collinsella stercoris DSM 13279]
MGGAVVDLHRYLPLGPRQAIWSGDRAVLLARRAHWILRLVRNSRRTIWPTSATSLSLLNSLYERGVLQKWGILLVANASSERFSNV